MRAYAVGATLLLHFLHEYILVNKQGCEEVAFADDFSVTVKTKKIKTYWEMLQKVGPLYGFVGQGIQEWTK